METCSIELCDRPAKKRGWCSAHYDRWLKQGDAGNLQIKSIRRRGEPTRECLFSGCAREAAGRGYCRGHLQQKRRGSELRPLPDRSLSILERFLSKVDKTDGCWIWTDKVNGNGYGQMSVGGKPVRAHRLSYQLHHGDVPKGMVVDHTCRNRACVNPDHLHAVTPQQNGQNRSVESRISSGLRGVYWDSQTNSWAVKVGHDMKSHWVGRFQDLAAAKRSVVAKRLALHANSLQDISVSTER